MGKAAKYTYLLLGFIIFATPVARAGLCADMLNLPHTLYVRHLQNKIRANGNGEWNVTRNLLDVIKSFHQPLTSALAPLGPDHHVIVMGSGEGMVEKDLVTNVPYMQKPFVIRFERLVSLGHDFAKVRSYGEYRPSAEVLGDLKEYFAKPRALRPKVTGITFQRTRTGEEWEQQVEFRTGEMFEQMDVSGIHAADVILDLYGITAYTYDISLTLNKYLQLLKKGGKIFIYPSAFLAAKIKTKSGRILSVVDYLRGIPGILVEEYWNGDHDNYVLLIRKLEEDVRIPPSKIKSRLPFFEDFVPRLFLEL